MSARLLGWLKHEWQHLWYTPGAAANLSAARIIIAAHAMWVVWSWDIAALSGIPHGFWWQARPSAQWRFLIFPGHSGVEQIIEALALVALLAVLLGLWTRVAALAAAVMLYHLAPLQTFLVEMDPHARGFTIAVLSLVVLSAARSADVWRVGRRTGGATAIAPHWEYTWPLRLMQLFVAQIYLFGFWGKLYHHGLGWFSPEQIGRQAVLFSHIVPGHQVSNLGSIVAGSAVLTTLGAVAVFLFELGFVTTLFSKMARRILVPAAVGFHLAILLSMQIFFVSMFHLLLFVNWSWIAERLAGLRLAARQARPA